jgi:hypothetical protein
VAALVESEFALRWIALDPRATWALCSDTEPLAELLIASIRETPSIADKGATKQRAQAATAPSLPSLIRTRSSNSGRARVGITSASSGADSGPITAVLT